MTAHAVHEFFVHLTWHVKDNQPILKGEIEVLVHNLIRERCQKLKGIKLREVNGIEDHVHLVIEYQPYVCMSKVIGDIKGGTSYEANKRLGRKLIYWQRGYGANTFGWRQLPWVIQYVQRQKEHHACGTVQERLERTAEEVPEGEGEAG